MKLNLFLTIHHISKSLNVLLPTEQCLKGAATSFPNPSCRQSNREPLTQQEPALSPGTGNLDLWKGFRRIFGS